MKIAVFGGTGRTGIPFVQQALDKGHSVTALARTPSKMTIQDARLTVVKGDVMDAEPVAKTIAGADVVVSLIGHTKETPRDMMETAGHNIVNAMHQHNVKRIVIVSGAGVRFEKDEPKLIDKFIGFLLKRMAGDVLEDSEKYVRHIQHSDLDWTVIRGPRFVDGELTGDVRVGYAGVGVGMSIKRPDMADYVLRTAEQGLHMHDMPVISN